MLKLLLKWIFQKTIKACFNFLCIVALLLNSSKFYSARFYILLLSLQFLLKQKNDFADAASHAYEQQLLFSVIDFIRQKMPTAQNIIYNRLHSAKLAYCFEYENMNNWLS